MPTTRTYNYSYPHCLPFWIFPAHRKWAFWFSTVSFSLTPPFQKIHRLPLTHHKIFTKIFQNDGTMRQFFTFTFISPHSLTFPLLLLLVSKMLFFTFLLFKNIYFENVHFAHVSSQKGLTTRSSISAIYPQHWTKTLLKNWRTRRPWKFTENFPPEIVRSRDRNVLTNWFFAFLQIRIPSTFTESERILFVHSWMEKGADENKNRIFSILFVVFVLSHRTNEWGKLLVGWL